MINGHLNEKRFYPIHNFTDTDYFSPGTNNSVDRCLVYLGRIEEIKGTKEAIDVALATGKKLIVAGNIQPGHEDYFESHIKPNFANPLISYIGPVNDEQKLNLLQNASALLFPIKWEEPFGIVMAEAMACGTPVIGFNRGSVPEVIMDGRSGYVVNNLEEMIAAVDKIDQIDRNDVRKECLLRFSRGVIAQQYISLFSELTGKN
jgi:glycosyltransferase involved in cell wall biosynthesis